MNNITLAQSSQMARQISSAMFWAELETAMQRLLMVETVVHNAGARDYRLPGVELRICLAAGAVMSCWLADSPVLSARGRVHLTLAAQAWLTTLKALGLPQPAVEARVQAASALLAAGFTSVTVRSAGELEAPESSDQALALAA